jgi:type II secretion system protein N
LADEKRTAPWKLIAGYAAFSVAAFVFFLYVTFPYQTIRARLVSEASAAGYELHVGDLGPGLLGITATDVAVKSKKPPGEDGQESGALLIDSVALRPALLPPGIAFRARLMDGTASGSFGGLGKVSVKVALDELDLSGGNMKAFSGVDLGGKLSGKLDLSIPKVAGQAPGAPAGPDFAQAEGQLQLQGAGLTVNGGTVTVPMYGTPTPMDLPRIAFGKLDAKMVFDKGMGTLEKLDAQSEDLTLMGSGTLKLARRPEFSESNLELRFKAEQEFQRRLGMIAAGLSMMQADPKDPTFRVAKVTGFIGRPNFR